MNTNRKLICIGASVCVFAVASLFAGNEARADLILFENTVQHGGLFANGTAAIDTFAGDTVIKFTPVGNYRSGGLEFYGGKALVIPAGETLLKVSAYSTDSGNMNGFTINMSTGSFNLGTDSWTLDGNPGAINAFSGGAWHELEFDLSTVAGFVSGTSILNGLVTFKTNTSQNPVYFRNISLATAAAVPEASSIAMAALGGAGVIFQMRRRKKAKTTSVV
ncbi:hypothetical protein Poly51_52720 [Rubripirellula tenax]|uniref:Ice-binding protein C-terminal domain-containing protein n=1 Tax=Rubripirellula tenax TaxID=2528015 RepID=A0A5C6EEM1_9BACT|nr:hypothetical protein [Rubripirellula tenax]TWU47472.1 hypothetical protein Poly51_52720 [Rubripirellula tenax]